MKRWIALLRGVNVGGKNKISMGELRNLAESLGYEAVSTYIQSGNLIFERDLEGDVIIDELESAIVERFGFAVPVVTRDAEEFQGIASSHPFREYEDDDRLLMVAFLDRAPSTSPSDTLPRSEFGPDRYAHSDRELYIHYPKGSARSKLTNDIIDRRLGVRSTMRNWRTVRKLGDLIGT